MTEDAKQAAGGDQQSTSLELSIVIPVLNEEQNISHILEEIEQKLSGRLRFELIFVDDGSSDRTAELVSAAASRRDEAAPEGGKRPIRLIRHDRVCGKSAALVTGVRAARATWVATMDGDGQNDPEDLWHLVTASRVPDAPRDLGLVAGQRRRRADTGLKQLSSKIGNGVRMRLSGDRTPDAACGLKLFRRDAFLELPRFENMHRFLSALFRREGAAVISVPVNDRRRLHGESKYGLHNRLWVGIADLLGVMWLQRRPLEPPRAKRKKAESDQPSPRS